MAININDELFKRYAPKKKIEIIKNLTSSELLATTPATMERIIKEAGRYQYKSVDKRLFISRDRQEGNSWNSMVEAVELMKGKLYLDIYFQTDSTDGNITEQYNSFSTVENTGGRSFLQTDMVIRNPTTSSTLKKTRRWF